MKQLTYVDWKRNPEPRMMWVWNSDEKDKVRRKVVYFLKGIEGGTDYLVVAVSPDDTLIEQYRYCAELEEKELIKEKERMTYKEFTWWLSDKPRREYMYTDNTCVFNTYVYTFEEQDDYVSDTVLVRENGGEWKKPTKDLFNA